MKNYKKQTVNDFLKRKRLRNFSVGLLNMPSGNSPHLLWKNATVTPSLQRDGGLTLEVEGQAYLARTL
jgi:hypothetical protein